MFFRVTLEATFYPVPRMPALQDVAMVLGSFLCHIPAAASVFFACTGTEFMQ